MNIHELELIGVTLYKCEGAKYRKDKRYPNTYYYFIDFANSEAVLVKLFVEFLEKVIKVDKEKIKAQVIAYEDLSETELLDYWSKNINVPTIRFQKIVRPKKRISVYKPSLHGTCKIRCSGKKYFLKLDELIIKNLGIGASLIKYNHS